MTEQTRPPGRRVYADDFTVEVDGVEYRPHAGEWVEFVRHSTVGEYLDALRFTDPERARSAATSEEGFAGLLGRLARSIVSWSWTDARGEPLPNPPGAAELELLPFEEIGWLRTVASNRRSDDDRKNGSTPSTEPSTGSQEAEAQTNG